VKPIFMALQRLRWSALCAMLAGALLPIAGAQAEKADKDKPTQIDANRMTSDDARRISIFEGNVVLTKGTILIRADRITVRQDAEGFQISTATGTPARFRQKRDGREEWIEGEALVIEVDDKKEKVELRGQARIIRDKDEIRGDVIAVDTRSEFFSVTGGKTAASGPNSEGRVRAVIQPKAQTGDAGASVTIPSQSPATSPPAPSKTQAR
jgi:lipopolysaccharide export system protein LptA